MKLDFDSILKTLAEGDEYQFELLASQLRNFPSGADPVAGIPWLVYAIDSGSLRAVKWMLKKGSDLSVERGPSVLHTAIDSQNVDRYLILEALLQAGAPLDCRGEHDWTPLHMAAAFNDVTAVKMLLEAGASTELRTEFDSRATPDEEAESLGSFEAAEVIRNWRLSHNR